MKYIFGLLFLMIMKLTSFSQGCNDAGFCTMGDMKSGQYLNMNKNELSLSSIFRLGEKETMWLSLQAQGNIHLWKSGKLSIQAPIHFIYGYLGFITSIGDITPAFSQNIYKKDSTKITLTIAGKIPINNGNIQNNREPLPMAYQPSQGTWDGITGISLFHKVWHIAIGYQHNFNSNQNMYIDSLRITQSAFSFFDSRKIDRGDDILLRIEKLFLVKNKPKFFFSVLPIYRLQEATIESASGNRISVAGSSGLTLNINAGIISNLADFGNLKFMFGVPTITRHVRPDGLTGTFVLSFSYDWSF